MYIYVYEECKAIIPLTSCFLPLLLLFIYIGPISPETITFTLTFPVTPVSVLGPITFDIVDDEIAEMDGTYNFTLESSQDRFNFTDAISEITVLDNDSELCTQQGYIVASFDTQHAGQVSTSDKYKD